jgi:pentatricopeptide repeat protein
MNNNMNNNNNNVNNKKVQQQQQQQLPYNRLYSIIINAWLKSGHINAPKESKNILIKLSNMFRDGISDAGPDTITYSSVIATYAAHGDVDGANDILKMMEDEEDEEDEEDDNNNNNKNATATTAAKPNMRTYSTLINVWSKSGRDDAPKEAKKLLDKVIDLHSRGKIDEGPNTIIYSSVIDTYAAHGDVIGATKILKMMEDDYFNSSSSSSSSSNKNKNNNNKNNNDAKPDMRTYSTLINAISKSGNVNASKQATDLLKKMINLFINGDLDEAPNAITYSSVMDAYAVDGDIDGAMNILNMMKDDYNSGNKTAKPNLRTYNILINAISKSDTDDAPQQAEILLTTMIYLYSKRELLEGPNSFTYSSVMYAYAVQGDIDGANDVHEMMKNEFKSGNKKCRPTVMTYSILIKAWAKSGKDNTPEEVEKILQEMKDLHKSGDLVEGPNHITYTSMIDSLQKFDGTEDRVKELISLQKK